MLDIGAAQTRLDQVGRLHRIDIKLAANASPAAAREAISALLPPGVTLATPDEAAQRVSNVSRAYRVNLNVLALVALFTGAFLVFSLQAQAVVARRTELAFLRISGLTAGELQRWLVGEAAIAGVIGSALGIASAWHWQRRRSRCWAATSAAASLPARRHDFRSAPAGRSRSSCSAWRPRSPAAGDRRAKRRASSPRWH